MYTDPNLPIKDRVADLLTQMTLAEKIGQMTQVEKNSITPAEVANKFIGSVLSGGGANPTPNTPEAWTEMVRRFQTPALQTRLGIPLIYGVDAVHGHNNLKGAVIFPHNIGLGATRDAALIERIGQITAAEILATGVHWNFGPTVAVPRDIRWGRTYEGYSQDTDLVSTLGTAYLRGLQNAGDRPDLSHPRTVLGSVKHYVGDGGTRWGSTPTYEWIEAGTWSSPDDRWSLDQGVTDIDEATLRAIHLPPYQVAIEAGAKNIMVSYSSWDGLKLHGHKYLLTDVLKNELGFSGFLVSDYRAINQLAADNYTCVVASINAGLDMIMVPTAYEPFIADLTRAVEQGDVPLARIDDAVRRILAVKFDLGLFEQPFADPALLNLVGSEAHRAVAREAVQKSLVLLKNDNQTLPLAKDTPLIFVAGQAADDIGLQCGGWTIEWQGQTGNITPGTTLLAGLKNVVSKNTTVHFDPQGNFAQNEGLADVGLVVLGETPYAEGEGDRGDLNLPAADVALIERVRPRCKKMVVILVSGRPLIITEHLAQWDVLVAAWLPGTEGQGVAEVLFGDYPFSGKLSYSWPRSMAQIPLSALLEDDESPLFPFGYGLA